MQLSMYPGIGTTMVKMNEDTFPNPAKRAELAAFLRSRREQLTPEMVGLPSGFRRRTPGLRREELAMLADVGTTWYTWLEQGREVRASQEVLSSLANALRLNPVERQHLFALSGRSAPAIKPTGPEILEPSIERMLTSLSAQPAYLTGRRWDVLGWNPAAVAVFGDYQRLEGDARNLMHLVFANTRHRRLLLEWDDVARTALAMFRLDAARYAGDPDFDRLITELSRTSIEFKAWWAKHEVLKPLSNIKRLKHPRQGLMSFEYTSFALTDGSDRMLTVYTPLDANNTKQKLHKLLSDTVVMP